VVLCGLSAALLAGGAEALGAITSGSSERAAEQANLMLIHAAPESCGGTVVAVLDSGVDAGNPHLAAQILPGWNVVTRSADTIDTAGHGTKVAGVVAGDGGTTGFCRGARILPVVVWTLRSAPTEASIARGIRWATAHGAGVINVSLAGTRAGPTLARAVAYARAHDVVVVAAAGNTGSAQREYPAAVPGVLAVSGVDTHGALAAFSSFGSWVGIAAPATRVLTTTLGGGLQAVDGTSFAAPLVAAAAAVLRTRHPSWSAAVVVRRLEQTADDAGPVGVDPAFGHGILDVAAALGTRPPAQPAAAQGDRFEPDDLPADAAPLPLGTTLHATFAPEGDADWYVLRVDAPTGIALAVTSPLGDLTQRSTPIVEVYDAGLRLLARRDGRYDGPPGELDLTFPAQHAGRYYVHVTNAYGSRGSYAVAAALAPLSRWSAWEDEYVGVDGTSVAVGDVTGDGRDDVLMTTAPFERGRFAGQLVLFVQRPDGTLAPPRALPLGARFCCGDVAVGDVNGDGEADVAATLGANGVELFLQRQGRLRAPVVLPTASPTTGVAIRDGELVVTEVDGTRVLRRGGVRAAAAAAPPAPALAGCKGATGRHAVAVGDVNGDRLADVVCAGPFGLVVVRRRSGWTEPGAWVLGARDGVVRFARRVEASSISARTVRALDDHGNLVRASIAFDASTDTLTVRAPGAVQLRVDVRDTAGNRSGPLSLPFRAT